MKYDHQLDLRSSNNSHVQLLARVPPGSDVLELGCATGYMSAHLQERKGCRVVGVDIDAEALEKAAPHCRRVLHLDVERPDWQDALDGERFDVVMCADIIEHLKDPESFLRGLPGLLREDGRLLASVPNGAHASIRLELLQGQLTYEETGLLDRTHLHLYTHQSLMALVSRAGFAVEELSYTFHDIPDEVLSAKLRQAGLEPTAGALARLHAPEAVAYQYVLSARAAPESASGPWPELTDKPLRDSEEVYGRVHARLHEVQVVAQRRQEVIDAKDAQLADRERQIATRDHQLGMRDQQIARKDEAIAELNARIAQVQKELTSRGRELASQNLALADRDGRVAAQGEQLRSLDERVLALLNDKARQELHLLRLRGENDSQRERLASLRAENARLELQLGTLGWRVYRRLTSPLQWLGRVGPYAALLWRKPRLVGQWVGTSVRLLREGGLPRLRWYVACRRQREPAPGTLAYRAWIDAGEAAAEPGAGAVRSFVAQLTEPPTVAVVMPVYEPRLDWLREALDSVLAQSYPHWELCIADDASPTPAVRALLDDYARRDPRIKVVHRERNGHISAATNSALELASGSWVGFMDQDDLLAPNALYHVVRAVTGSPEVRVVYSDEDKVTECGVRYGHYFKPDYNPDLMLSHNLLCHFSVYRRDLVAAAGGLREGYEGAQDYDLALRCLARTEAGQIRHVPRVLYHWRAHTASTAIGAQAKPYAMDAAVRAVSGHLAEQGIAARVTPSPLIEGMLRVQYPVPEPAPPVSVIIPTRNGLGLLRLCLDSLRHRTEYPGIEILVVDNQSDDPATLDYLERIERAGTARVLRYDRPFNYAAINNYAVGEATGELLCFMNNDIEVTAGEWLAEMVSHAVRPGIGAVGARLLYPDGRLQHGGVVTGLGGIAGHAMKYLPRPAKGYNGRAVLVQNYSAVTAACMVVRRAAFEEIGGFDVDNLPVAFNDVDLCLRLRERGYRNLWTPFAELYHHESASRGPEDTPEKQARFAREIEYMRTRWGQALLRDPAYNPNLTLDREDFTLGVKPRLGRGAEAS